MKSTNRSVMFGFPAKVSWPIIVVSPRKVTSSSQQMLNVVSDFPTAISFSKYWRGETPPRPPLFTCLVGFTSGILFTRSQYRLQFHFWSCILSSHQNFNQGRNHRGVQGCSTLQLLELEKIELKLGHCHIKIR